VARLIQIEGYERPVRLLVPLAFLSPRIAAIVNGNVPADLTVTNLAKARAAHRATFQPSFAAKRLALCRDLRLRRSYRRNCGDFLAQPVGRVGEKITVLMHVQRWTGMSLQSAARAFSRPAAPSTMTSSGVFRPRLTRSSRSARLMNSIVSVVRFEMFRGQHKAIIDHPQDWTAWLERKDSNW